jgi:signal peptidase I
MTDDTENSVSDAVSELSEADVQDQKQDGSADGDGQVTEKGAEKESPPAKKKKKKRTAKSYAISFAIKVGVTAVVLWVTFTFFAGIYICHSNSAYPTIRDGEFCLIYRLAKLEQGTMIVYSHGGETHFGRVVAFGGDEVSISNDYVTVNGYGLSENVVYPTPNEGSAIEYPYKVPKDCVFVLNDYRSDLSDSRTFGAIPVKEVKGAVVFTMRTRGI